MELGAGFRVSSRVWDTVSQHSRAGKFVFTAMPGSDKPFCCALLRQAFWHRIGIQLGFLMLGLAAWRWRRVGSGVMVSLFFLRPNFILYQIASTFERADIQILSRCYEVSQCWEGTFGKELSS